MTLNPSKAIQDNFRFSDPRQEQKYNRLLLIGPGPAAFYRDACRLIAHQPSLATTTHLVLHLLREVESGLRDVLVISPSVAADSSNADTDLARERNEQIRRLEVALAVHKIAESDPLARALV